jgi:shikimate dehydrogenase
MHPKVHTSPWPEGLSLPENAFIYDLVYNPSATVFVQTARRIGNRACTGLGMLVEQAALSLECWTGFMVPREVMWKAIQPFLPISSQDKVL